jgi:hypothetical protein
MAQTRWWSSSCVTQHQHHVHVCANPITRARTLTSNSLPEVHDFLVQRSQPDCRRPYRTRYSVCPCGDPMLSYRGFDLSLLVQTIGEEMLFNKEASRHSLTCSGTLCLVQGRHVPIHCFSWFARVTVFRRVTPSHTTLQGAHA